MRSDLRQGERRMCGSANKRVVGIVKQAESHVQRQKACVVAVGEGGGGVGLTWFDVKLTLQNQLWRRHVNGSATPSNACGHGAIYIICIYIYT